MRQGMQLQPQQPWLCSRPGLKLHVPASFALTSGSWQQPPAYLVDDVSAIDAHLLPAEGVQELGGQDDESVA